MKKVTAIAISVLFLVCFSGLALACDGSAKTAKAKASSCDKSAKTSTASASGSSCSMSKTSTASASCSKTESAGLPVDVAWAKLDNGVVLYYNTSCHATQAKLEKMASGGELCCPYQACISDLASADITYGVSENGIFAVITATDAEDLAVIQGELTRFAADD